MIDSVYGFPIATKRLSIRNWQKSDYPEFAKFFSDPKPTQFLGGPLNAEQAWRLLATYIGQKELTGLSYWAITNPENHLVGSVGIWQSPGWPEPELGYWLLPKFHGQGYAFEAANAIQSEAHEGSWTQSLVSYIHADNLASLRLAEKLGGKRDGTIELSHFGEHSIFRYW